MISMENDWAILNHFVAWTKGCVRMVTYVYGSSRYIFEYKGTDPVNGDLLNVRGVGPNLQSAINDLYYGMATHLTDPVFRRTLAGADGGGMGGGGEQGPAKFPCPTCHSTQVVVALHESDSTVPESQYICRCTACGGIWSRTLHGGVKTRVG